MYFYFFREFSSYTVRGENHKTGSKDLLPDIRYWHYPDANHAWQPDQNLLITIRIWQVIISFAWLLLFKHGVVFTDIDIASLKYMEVRETSSATSSGVRVLLMLQEKVMI
jgi:hypothetical protein